MNPDSVSNAAARIAPTDRLRQAPHAVSTAQGGETVVVDVADGQYHILNDVGTRVWALVHAGATMCSIVETLGREYVLPADAPPDLLERDVAALVSQLANVGLIVVDTRVGVEQQ